MVKMYLKIPKIIFICLLFINCRPDKPPKKIPKKILSPITNSIEINKINFYFENSGSMNGYLEGNNFRQSMAEIIYNFKIDSVDTYFVNTKEYKVGSILNKIRGGVNKIRTKGIGNSDHKFIFSNAIKNTSNNNLSIVVTDGIYSMSNGNLTLGDVEKDIEEAFENALLKNEIETVVLKMSSNFKGTYYTESKDCGNIPLNQERPYYILLFGNKEVINKALDEIVVTDKLDGYKEQARFFITKDLKINYTVLTKGEEKEGNFRTSNHKPIVKEIEDAEKFEKKGILLKDSYLQFGIALDFSDITIPDSYLTDTLNYSVEDNTGYKVIEVKSVKNLDKKSKSYMWIENLNKKGKYKYTHVAVVRAKTNLYGDLEIDLDINFPNWIAETGTDSDCNVKNDSTTTFAFNRLMNGISKAYENVNNKNEFFELKINIKP